MKIRKFRPDFVVFIHRIIFKDVPKKGGLDIIVDHFVNEGKSALLIEFPLYLNQSDEILVSRYTKGEKKILHRHRLLIKNSLFLWVLEPFVSIFYTLKYARNVEVVMTADPLTSFPAVILRKFGFIRKHYYHFVDYSKERFSNKLLNGFYMSVMRFSVKNADLIGCVSKRIIDILKRKVPSSNCVHIPNSPDFTSLEKYRISPEQRAKFSLSLTIAEVSKKYHIKEIVTIVELLKRDFPSVFIRIIGDITASPEYFKEVKDYIAKNKLEKSVNFTGFIPKSKNLEYVGKSYVSLAFYDTTYSHVVYGDSLKIREAAALGIPVVAGPAMATIEEMQSVEAGIFVEDVSYLYDALKNIFEDETLYMKLATNALEWAEKLDKKTIISKYLDFFNYA